MHWLFLLIAIGALIGAFVSGPTWLMVLCLLVSLVLFVAWAMGLYAARIGDSSRDESQMIDPVELRRLREIAEARKAGLQSPAEPPHGS
ncbi:hypothetical protein CSC74_17095 [Pseudoxanthomonas yeongjuensis]|jgi:hypothetical protein|uniref:hypothetical protein n=1 Tax=Pseudoxanthomonas yeongjuensis TaxID=377616 RepID=UPI001390BA11|nr:hypothetical protein [Pseudoxanthomonas yeongjuensis]KAF1713806.1 hypothetical protein CSC74_17095 [Pseudoxanthomonas yeongjuensis]